MKLHSTGRTVTTSGNFETKRSSIKISRHAFEVLSTGIYTNKVKAVIREILCNAWDAERSMGIDPPRPTLKLPNQLDTDLVVIDRGPGMSHEMVMENYMTYFYSTKQESDDEIGGFGLGSKSPLAYVDMFQVESRHVECSECGNTVTPRDTKCSHCGNTEKRRVKRSYAVYVDDEKMPCVSLISEESLGDNEFTGMTVTVPVKTHDIRNFCTTAQEVVKAFVKCPPEVKGNGTFVNLTFDTEMRSDNGMLVNDESLGRHQSFNSIKALCGNVLYNIPLEELEVNGTKVPRYSLRLMYDVVLLFDIGEVQPAPSRESLDMTKKTKENVLKKIEEFQGDVLKHLETKVDKNKTLWEQACVADDLGKLESTYVSLCTTFGLSKNLKPELQAALDNHYKVDLKPWNKDSSSVIVKAYSINAHSIKNRVTKPPSDRYQETSWIGGPYFRPKTFNKVFWIPPDERFWWRKLKALVEDEGYNGYFLVIQCPKNIRDSVYKAFGDPPKDIKETLEDVKPWVNPITISTRKGRKAKVHRIIGSGNEEEVEVDLSEGAYFYVPTSHWQYSSDMFSLTLTSNHNGTQISTFVSEVYRYMGLRLKVTKSHNVSGHPSVSKSPNVIPCYVIPKTLQHKIKSPRARNLMEFVETQVKRKAKLWSIIYQRHMLLWNQRSRISQDLDSDLKTCIGQEFMENHEFFRQLQEYYNYLKSLETRLGEEHYHSLWSKWSNKPNTGNVDISYIKNWLPTERYPLLKVIKEASGRYYTQDMCLSLKSEIQEYIELKDSKAQRKIKRYT